MHVLFIPSWYENKSIPTLGSFFREQAEAMAKENIRVTIAYPGFNSIKSIGKDMYGKSQYIKNGVHVYRDDSYNLFYDRLPIDIKSRLFKRKLFKLYRKIVKERGVPDIIHIHSSVLAGYGGICLGNRYKIPVVITEHSSAFLQNNFKYDQKKLVTKCLNESDCIIAVSNGLKENILKYTENPEIRVIPNIIDIDRFSILNSNEESDKFTFLTVCYLNKNKGLDVLLKAFALKYKNKEKFELVIGGDGYEKENLINLTHILQIEKQVKFLGPLTREQVNLEMNKANCFVLPSRFETFGVVLIEALSCGLPIISTKTSGPLDIVNKSNGILVDIENVNQLALAMDKIYKNYNTYIKDDIRKNCINMYSEKNIISKIKDIYITILKKRGVKFE